jgi:CDI immunity protein
VAAHRQPIKLCSDWEREFPVQAFFNAISDDALLDIVSHLLKRQGYSSDYCHCRFPADLDPNEPTFEGVRFSHFDDSLEITERRLAEVLDMVCETFQTVDQPATREMAKLVIEFRQSISGGRQANGR